jgi:glycosyltransferase involved in cell wall biosynthesis
LAQTQGSHVVVLASREAGARFKAECPDVTVRSRNRARRLLWEAHSVLQLSDGARFPSLSVAAFAASIPVVATSTDVNRELLEGSADLVELNDLDAIIASVLRNFADESHRQLLMAAGKVRAVDFSPAVVAERYERLYRDAVSESRAK